MNQLSRNLSIAMVFCMAVCTTIQPMETNNRRYAVPAVIGLATAAIGAYVGYVVAQKTEQKATPNEQIGNSMASKIKQFIAKYRTPLYTIAGATAGLGIGSCGAVLLKLGQKSLGALKHEAIIDLDETIALQNRVLDQKISENLINANDALKARALFNDIRDRYQTVIEEATTPLDIRLYSEGFVEELNTVITDLEVQAQEQRQREEQAQRQQEEARARDEQARIQREQVQRQIAQELERRQSQELARRQEEILAAQEAQRLKEERERKQREQQEKRCSQNSLNLKQEQSSQQAKAETPSTKEEEEFELLFAKQKEQELQQSYERMQQKAHSKQEQTPSAEQTTNATSAHSNSESTNKNSKNKRTIPEEEMQEAHNKWELEFNKINNDPSLTRTQRNQKISELNSQQTKILSNSSKKIQEEIDRNYWDEVAASDKKYNIQQEQNKVYDKAFFLLNDLMHQGKISNLEYKEMFEDLRSNKKNPEAVQRKIKELEERLNKK